MATDISPLWRPFTQHALTGPPVPVSHARGATLHTQDGREILDGISSWWVNIHGHGHPKIVQAVQQQAAKLDQVIFAGFTHAPAEKLARKLITIAPPGLARVFLSDSGSTAVEAALKMAIGYWVHRATPRRRVVALEHGYHGDTFGAMAAGARGAFTSVYEPYLFSVDRLPFPASHDGLNTIAAFEALLREHPDDIAALILEPLILGAGGMKIYGANILKSLHEICRRHRVLLIADEVMTGWGRTGTRFACEQAGISPDLLCLSKGLTGGMLPMGATLATDEIFDAFCAPDRARMFMHSSSYTGNPLACAAALAALDIWDTEPVFENIRRVTASQDKAVQRFSVRTDVMNVRALGTIFALDIKADDPGYLSGLGPRLYDCFLENNVLLRPLGNTVYIMPPYVITDPELERIHDIVALALDHIDRSGHDGAQRAA